MVKKGDKIFIRFKAEEEQGRLVGVYKKVKDEYKDMAVGQYIKPGFDISLFSTKSQWRADEYLEEGEWRDATRVFWYGSETGSTWRYKPIEQMPMPFDILICSESQEEPVRIMEMPDKDFDIDDVHQFKVMIPSFTFINFFSTALSVAGDNHNFYGNKEKEFVHRYIDAVPYGTESRQILERLSGHAFFFLIDREAEYSTLRIAIPIIGNVESSPFSPPPIPGEPHSVNGFTAIIPVVTGYDESNNPIRELGLSEVDWEHSYIFWHENMYWIISIGYPDPPEPPPEPEPELNPMLMVKGKFVIDPQALQSLSPPMNFSPPIGMTEVHEIRSELEKKRTPVSLKIMVKEKVFDKKGVLIREDEIYSYIYSQPPNITIDRYLRWGELTNLGEPAGELDIPNEGTNSTQATVTGEVSSDFDAIIAPHLATLLVGDTYTETEIEDDFVRSGFARVVDEKGSSQVRLRDQGTGGTDYIKVISQSSLSAWPSTEGWKMDSILRQFYFGESLLGNTWFCQNVPSIMKKNDDYVFMVRTFDKCLIWKEGVEYVLPATQEYEINGVKIEVEKRLRTDWLETNFTYDPDIAYLPAPFSDFLFYFQCTAMNAMYVANDGRSSFFGDLYPASLVTNFHQVSTWYGDYIYKVRTDEFFDGTFLGDELIKNNFPASRTRHGFSGYDFMKSLEKDLKRDLKIYRPDTTSLWVEKYRVTLDKKALTAKIEYVRRFSVPFKPPIEEEIPPYPEVETVFMTPLTPVYASMLNQLCSISYIP